MPVRVREMSPAIPLAAALAVLLGAVVAGFIHARNCLTKLFLRFCCCCVHGILHSPKDGAAGKGHSAGTFYHAHFVYAAASNIHPSVGSSRHVAHRTAAGRNDRTRKLFRLGIELNDGIRFHPGFAVPNHSVWSNRNSIRSRFRTAWRRPHLHRARTQFEPAEVASAEVREIDAVTRIDCHSPWPRSLRKCVFRDLHRPWIEFCHFIRCKLAEDGDALAIDGDPIGMRILRGDMFQVDFTCDGIKSSHHIGGLEREPQQAVAIKDGGVWVLTLRIRNLEFSYGSSLRVEFADVSLEISREPDI